MIVYVLLALAFYVPVFKRQKQIGYVKNLGVYFPQQRPKQQNRILYSMPVYRIVYKQNNFVPCNSLLRPSTNS